MIERYASPEMGKIRSPQNRYQRWRNVELAVCEVQTKRGVIPEKAMEAIRSKAGFDPKRIDLCDSGRENV